MTHFGHHAALAHDGLYLPSHITTVAERDEMLIENWNKKVGPNDIVYHLGDFAFRNAAPIEYYTDRLNGTIHLVLGNHDHEPRKRPHVFASVQDHIYLRHNGRKFHLYHYPLIEWRSSFHGSIHLFGHVHGHDVGYHPRRLDVGVMVHNYTPLSYDEVMSHIHEEEEVLR